MSLTIAFAAVIASPALAAPAIPNPSFEANAVFATSPGTIATNAPITGWTANNATRVGLNPAGGLNFHADNGAVPNGTRVAFLNSVSGGTATLSTTITGLVAGQHYRVQFRYNRKSGAVATSPAVVCRVAGAEVGAINGFNPVNSVGVHTNPYETHTLLFIATAATALLEISNTTTADSTLLVDNFTISTATPIQVTNVNNGGPGSLRQALATAEGTAAFNLITFAPALSGKRIELMSPIVMDDLSGVTIDAFPLPKGITIANAPGVVTRMFTVNSGAYHFRGLNLTGGTSTSATVFNVGPIATVSLTRCALFDNGVATTNSSGALNSFGTTYLTQCTVTQNSSTGPGGALSVSNFGQSRMVLNQCTVTGNTGGSGGGIANLGALVVINSIVAGNTGTTGADILNDGATARFTRVGNNVIEEHDNINGGTSGGDPPIDAPAGLAALADNGGPTRTMAVQPGSAARNGSVNSLFTTDQRGRPIKGTKHDIGAYDVQNGTFTVTTLGSVAENAGTTNVTVTRSDGFEGAVTVNRSTVPGTASAADFTVSTNQVINFADGQLDFVFAIPITNDALVESNESFSTVLSAPTGGATLGTPSTGTVTIIDPSYSSNVLDTVNPPAPSITNPAANVKVNFTGQIVITGTATDNKGVDEVQVSMVTDGGTNATVSAVLDKPDATSTGWRTTIGIGVPFSSMRIDVTSRDGAGRFSPVTTRTVAVLHPLRVLINGGGSVTAGFAPESFRPLGLSHTITATPAPGQLFQAWQVLGATPAEIGVPAVALDRPTLTFQFRFGMQLVAVFADNPFDSGFQGNYNGLVRASSAEPAGGTPASNSSEGFWKITLQPTSAFTGTILIDGLTHSFSGALDVGGIARFGTSRSTVLFIARTGKPTLRLQFLLDMIPPTLFGTLQGVLDTLDSRGEIIAQSTVSAFRARYNGTTQVVPANLLGPGGANQVYNVIFRRGSDAEMPAGFENSFFPQGTGIGRMTLTKAGILTLTDCTLADGTTGITASTFLVGDNEATLFLSLYSKRGFLHTTLDFNTANSVSDVEGDNPIWMRPEIPTSHYYSAGWPEIIPLIVQGAKYTVTAGQNAFKAADGTLQAPDADGNVRIQFHEGQLTEDLVKALNLSIADVVTKVPSNDPTFTLTINRATGLFSGNFLHTDTNVVPFKGILYQKANLAGGHGFFLTKQPVPINFTGEAGSVRIFESP